MLVYHFGSSEKTFLLYNGIHTERFVRSEDRQATKYIHRELNLPETTLLIGTIRGLDYHHGVDHLILAAAELTKLHAGFHVCIIGDGIRRREFENLRSSLGITSQLSFLGARTDVPQILNSLDIFVMPSRNETFGIAAAEAMMAKLPVVAYAVGGLPEVVEDGVTGLLVQKRDPKELAKAISILMQDAELRKRYGEAGSQRVQTLFTFEKTYGKYLDLYRTMYAQQQGKEQ